MGSWLLLSRRLSFNYYFADGGCTAGVHKHCMYDSPVYYNTPGALKERLLCSSLLTLKGDRDFMFHIFDDVLTFRLALTFGTWVCTHEMTLVARNTHPPHCRREIEYIIKLDYSEIY